MAEFKKYILGFEEYVEQHGGAPKPPQRKRKNDDDEEVIDKDVDKDAKNIDDGEETDSPETEEDNDDNIDPDFDSDMDNLEPDSKDNLKDDIEDQEKEPDIAPKKKVKENETHGRPVQNGSHKGSSFLKTERNEVRKSFGNSGQNKYTSR